MRGREQVLSIDGPGNSIAELPPFGARPVGATILPTAPGQLFMGGQKHRGRAGSFGTNYRAFSLMELIVLLL